MENDFWHERWEAGEIGFHQSDIHWALKRHWSEIAGARANHVLVPLCGKSLDLRWLAEKGHEVTGVELSGKAVEEFFLEWGRPPTQSSRGKFTCWRAGRVELVAGDFFDYVTDKPFDLFYDRAALVALPRNMRAGYLEHFRAQLSDDARGLLVTFEYEQSQMDGPPFSVPEDELMQYPGFRFELLDRVDALGDNSRLAERGITALNECFWLVAVS